MAAPQTWAPERIAQLKALVAEGLTYKEIGRRLGVTKNQALSKSFRLGLQHPNSPAPRPTETSGRLKKFEVFPPPGHCLWSFGEVGSAKFRFCGKPADEPGSAWCAKHRARAYVAPGAHRSAAEAAMERAAKFGGRTA